ncbi:hypothetical protein KFL_010760010 [Klebsormidium nitens]|uniref:GPR1/FUN34/yaaH family protein n=1 Tax=Klebsormidium nitens TaxID=105231 RepID=A0A1Y1IUU6_KLENI|nr:hypothetical protein KFL_010760010 [Klebsormidium nitens]|eukprot:GAQ92626.1 hypothetical protein KFL_010760010 [Klebsormidium nitens]
MNSVPIASATPDPRARAPYGSSQTVESSMYSVDARPAVGAAGMPAASSARAAADDVDHRRSDLADPAALGLAAFAATTFVLSAHNAGWAPDLAWVGLALFYGGLAQLLAGMWDFRNNNTFGATAFSTYGAFWFSLASFILFVELGVFPASLDVSEGLGWFLVAFFIFNTYAMLGSLFLAKATLAVFVTLEVTLLLLFVGFFKDNTAGVGWTAVGGYFGVVTAVCAWYNSAAVLINRAATVHFMPVGAPVVDKEKLRAWHSRRKNVPSVDDTYTSDKRDSSV